MKNNNSFSNEDVVEEYLSGLLSEPTSSGPSFAPPENEDTKLANASKLLSQASVLERQQTDLIEKVVDDHKEIEAQVEINNENVEPKISKQSLQNRLDYRFQALFFDVAGLTLAVPLVSLGGIHKVAPISHVIGKPDWFKGIMLKGEDKINCVDSAKWIMPKQYDDKLAEKLDYKYLVMLEKTPWGLMSESLINTIELTHDEVKWRSDTTKRPWLAGMVREKMCALIDVANFIKMLESNEPSH